MNDTFLIALLAGLGGMVGWGAADFFAKKAVDVVGPIKSLVWAHGFGTAILLLVAVGQLIFFDRSLELPANAVDWASLAFYGSLQMIIYWLVYQGFEKGRLAVLNPVFASYSGLTALLAVILLHENLGLGLGVALLIIFIGNIALNLDPASFRSKKIKVSAGLKEVAAAAVLAAFWTLGWSRFVDGKDVVSSALLMYVFMSIAAVILARIMKVGMLNVPPKLWKFLFLMGLGETVAYIAISAGFSLDSHTTIVALVSGAFSVPTVILAYVFLKETLSKLQIAAVTSIIAGVVIVALVG